MPPVAQKPAPKLPAAPKARGEVAELSASLQNLCTAGKRTDKEWRTAKRDVFRKIINYLSVGMDMSSLFPSMLSCANLSSDDVVLKKMLYLYITTYATQIPDLALLGINQLLKDCSDQDPTVRGLALRSLCSLRVPNFLEYVTSPVNHGLEDRHPYVRRTAAMGVLKMYHIDSNIVKQQGMLDRVRQMMQTDIDPQVVANCLTVLMQTEPDVDALATKGLVYSLINRLKEFSDWSQCQVLELVSRYIPASESEVYDLLNVLEDRMGHANSAVVMAAIRVFLLLTLNMTATHQQVLERIKEPLKTLASRDDPTLAYPTLAHVLLLAQRAPMILERDFVTFYCRTHDPWYVKKIKMEILAAIASANNVYEIVNELTEYTRDINPGLAREAVKAVGRISLAVPDVSGIIERLLLFLEVSGTGSEHIVAETLIQMKDLLRRYPDMAEVCIGQMVDITPEGVEDPEARAALIWILGQFGHLVQAAPYLLEPFISTFTGEEPCVRLALLSSASRLFFKRPPECQRLLGGLLSAAMNDTNQDVHDRALLYYRLLRTNIGEAERIISPPMMAVSWFSESMSEETRNIIFKEFNTLSVVFQTPSSTFVDSRDYHKFEDEAPGAAMGHQGTAAEVADLLGDGVETTLLGDHSDAGDDSLLDMGGASAAQSSAPQGGGLMDLGDLLGGSIAPAPAAPAPVPPSSGMGSSWASPPVPPAQDAFDLGGLGQLLPGGGVSNSSNAAGGGISDLGDMLGMGAPTQRSAPVAAAAAPQPPQMSQDLELDPKVVLAPAFFQERWKAMYPVHQYTQQVSADVIHSMAANNHRDFTQHMGQAYIMTIASGGSPPQYKYYFYAQVLNSDALMLIELIVRTDTQSASVTFKTMHIEMLPQFLERWQNCFLAYGF